MCSSHEPKKYDCYTCKGYAYKNLNTHYYFFLKQHWGGGQNICGIN